MTTPATIAAPPLPRPWLARWFTPLLLAAVLLRLLVGLGLYSWALEQSPDHPVAALSQRLMAPDGLGYHVGAEKVQQYWADPNPHKVLRHEHMVARFSVVVAVFYHLIWNSPLVMTLVNCLCYLAAGYLALTLARRLGQPSGRAAALALIICLWPPSLAWSSLPMKDSPSVFLVLAILNLILFLARPRGAGWGRRLLAALAFLACAALMTYMRFYFAYVLLGACALPLLARLLPGPAPRPTWPALFMVLALGVAAFLLTKPWHQEYFIFFENGELLPRSQFEAKSRKADFYRWYDQHVTHPKPGEAVPQAPPDAEIANTTRPDVPDQTRGLGDLWQDLRSYRERFQHFAGRSLSPGAGGSLPTALWQAVCDSLFFPYPWQRWPASERWTALNLAVSAQGLLWYGLLAGIVPGIILGVRRRPDVALPLALWGLGLGLVLAYVMVNRGTLFRLRDLALMPLILFWDFSWLTSRLRRPRPPAA